MKNTFYIFIFIAFIFSSCKKEEKPTSVSIKTEKITPGTTTVLFEVTYEYPSVLSEVKIHLATNENMSNATIYPTQIDGKRFSATITGLKANATYFYYYEFISGFTSLKSNVDSFINIPLTPIEINGVKWAPCNVSFPGCFAKKPFDAGMLYQWGSNVGWSSTKPLAATDENNKWRDLSEKGNMWQPAKNPCPPGWRVPTKAEFQSLINTDYVTREWRTENGIEGYRLTDKDSGDSLFLPAAAYRNCYGSLGTGGKDGGGGYWSSTPESSIACYLNFYSKFTSYCNREFAYSIRCVAK